MAARPAATLGLLALALAGGHLGPLSGTTGRFLAVVALIVLAAAEILPSAGGRTRHLRHVLAFAAVAAATALLVTRTPAPEGPVAGASLALLLAALAARRLDRRDSACLEDLAAAGILLAGFSLLTQRIPAAWRGVEETVRATTAALGRLTGADTSLGPSVAGVPVLVLILGYLLVRWARSGRGEAAATLLAMAWVALIGLVAWGAGVSLLLRLVVLLRGALGAGRDAMPLPGWPAGVAVYLPLALFTACAFAVALLAPGRRAPATGAETPRSGARRPILAGLLSALLAGLSVWPSIALPGGARQPRVTFLEPGVGNWEVPTFGAQGLDRVGMFGLLPRYLEAAGFVVRRSGREADAATLAESDVVVVINPTAVLPRAARDRLEGFIRDGGGLLVLGDHTDLMGIQEPLGDLLEPYGIAYRFDSAFTPGHWHNDAGFLPGPLTRGLDDANSRFQQSTGASLQIARGAEAVATARWGFSDAGDRANADNAFLGDYIYQASEPLGDLPVVALARRGRGRVLAFGDTSSFQNIALPMSSPFIVRVFEVAAGSDRAAIRLLSPVAILAWVLLAGWVIVRRGPAEVAAVLAGFSLGLVLAGFGGRALWPAGGTAAGRLAIVDAGHHNDVSLDLWAPDALTGLGMNLARNGFLPIVDRDRTASLIDTASAYVTVAPRQRFTTREVGRLRALAERGGEVIVACGWEEKGPVSPLLEEFGFDVGPVPLGPVPVLRKIHDPEVFGRLQLEPHFAEAWPVEGVEQGRDEVLYAAGDYPIVVRRPVGRGGFTLIADTRFLQNRTLEEEGAAWSGNIALLRRVLRERSARAAARGAGS